MKILISYSHYDDRFRDELETHLASLRRLNLANEIWTDRRIAPGREWEQEIDASLADADLILLLVSPHFIASNYCWTIEMARAVERHERGEAIVVPVIIRPCDWTVTRLGKLQALPKDAKPISTWKMRDAGWTDVTKRLRDLIQPLVPAVGGAVPADRAILNSKTPLARIGSPKGRALSGETEYLMVYHDDRAEAKRVGIMASLRDVVGESATPFRVSPIFPLQGNKHTRLSQQDYWLLLLGPLSLAQVPDITDPSVSIWLSIGRYNILLGSQNRTSITPLLAWAGDQAVCFELWHLKSGRVELSTHSIIKRGLSLDLQSLLEAAQSLPANQELVEEFVVAIASACTACPNTLPQFEEDLISLCEFVGECIHTGASEGELRGLLAEINHGLHRLSEQALGYIAPVTELQALGTRYSVLGMGMATLALRSLYRFATDVFADARIPERLEMLKSVDTTSFRALDREPTGSAFWQRDFLSELHVPPGSREARRFVPLIPFFDNRSGYRSTLFTISAPTTFVTGCNSFLTTPFAISHELVHVLVRGVMGVLLPLEGDAGKHLLSVPPRNALDGLQRYFLLGFLALEIWESNTDQVDLRSQSLQRAIANQWATVEELLTHTLDFLYFYGGNAESYVKGCWYAWNQIPNIENRVAHYVLLTVSAVMASHLRSGQEDTELAIQQVRLILRDIITSGNAGRYVDKASNMLEQEGDEVTRWLLLTRSLVQLCRTFLYSPSIAVAFSGQSPFVFLWNYANDSPPSAPRSAWLLNMLAFDIGLEEATIVDTS